MYRKLICEFKKSYRVIAFDHIGMGLSERPSKNSYSYRLKDRIEDLQFFMESLKITGDIRLVAHDWGGPVAIAFAENNPQKINSLVLMNTGTRFPKNYHLPLRLRLFKGFLPLSNFLIKQLGLFNRGVLDQVTLRPLPTNVWDGFFAPYHEPVLRDGVASFVEDIPLHKSHPSYETLASIDKGLSKLSDKPVFLIWGQLDFVFSSHFLYDLKKRLPRSKVLTLPHSGHLLLEDEFHKIFPALRHFWQIKANKASFPL
jgi:haloalkane dehalogenase